MKEGYKSIEEILQEVADEEGIDIREIKDVWKHQKFYVKNQMDAKGVYAIFLPFIGTLSLNTKQFSVEIKGRIRGLYKNFVNKVNDLENHENYNKFANSHKKLTGVNRLARRVIKKYKTGLKTTRSLLVHNKCWEIIAKYSNGVYDKNNDE